jgi:phenylacetate-CoA ligase
MSNGYQRHLQALRRSQFAPRDKLNAHQLALLERLVRHAHEHVPYFRQRLECVLKEGRFRREAWSEIPLLTRREIQEHAADLYAKSVPNAAGATTEGSTSGSAGSPLSFRQSHLAIIAADCQQERMLEAHGIDRTAHEARIRVDRHAPYPDGRELRGWNLACPSSRLSSLDVGTPIAEQARWLAARAPRYLITYPSNAAAIAHQLESSGTHVHLSGVMTVGEQVLSEQREAVQRVFGCRILDSYGATEIGYLAFECPAQAGYHLAHEAVLVELVDHAGVHVPAGTLGRVVLTSLYNYAMPLIRYAIGDYAVTADGPCPCGRTLPRLASIGGRARNIFTFGDGSQRSPWGWRSAFQHLVPARQMQIVQTQVDVIEIRYVPIETAPSPDPNLVSEAGRRRIHPSVSVHTVPVDHIPRLPSGKVEDCISLVTAQ